MFRWGMGIKLASLIAEHCTDCEDISRIQFTMGGLNTVHNLPWVGIILGLVMGCDGWHCTKDEGVGGDCLRQHWSKTAGLSFFKSRMILIMMKTMMALVYKQ